MITAKDLGVVPHFSDLDPPDLEWLATQFELMELTEGEEPFEPGANAEHLMVVLSGRMQVFGRQSGVERLFDTFGPGRITGYLPYSRMKSFQGRATAIEDLRLALMHKDRFADMLYRIPVLGQRLIGLMSDRVRSSARNDQEREKMLALGKLSAGLAHELNNPAAAVRRASAELHERLEALPRVVAQLAALGISPEKVNPDGGFCSLGGGHQPMTAVDLADREDELLDWLEDRDIDEAWRLAPTLAEAGMTTDDLDLAVSSVAPDAVPHVLAWIENSLRTTGLLREIEAAGERISNLVGSVKSYSHMDRSPDKQPTDISDGIENTLTMLGHKIKKKAIAVNRSFRQDLPPVPAHPGELNQVWTNLIDNAVDAMPEGGTLSVEATLVGETAQVRIADNGHGIPEDVLPRIFEPFFTTKDVGEGTGLGLEIVHRIVTEQHAGRIDVTSEPGETVFTVRLPLNQSAPV